MRILGYIEHPVLKITVFQMDNKLSVKLENNLYEQIYKFRQGENLNNFEDIRKLVDEKFVEAALAQMANLHQIKQAALNRFLPVEEDDFEEII